MRDNETLGSSGRTSALRSRGQHLDPISNEDVQRLPAALTGAINTRIYTAGLLHCNVCE